MYHPHNILYSQQIPITELMKILSGIKVNLHPGRLRDRKHDSKRSQYFSANSLTDINSNVVRTLPTNAQ